jgi:hypothetical protein
VIVEREEAAMKQQSEAAQAAAGEVEAKGNNQPVKAGEEYGRNDLVTITDGKETQTIKFKKAETLIATGSWKIIQKS